MSDLQLKKSLYSIIYELECSRDGDTEEENYGVGAIYGESLDRLIAELEHVQEWSKTWDAKVITLTKERDKALKELQETKDQLAEAFKNGFEVKTSQGGRAVKPGDIVLYTRNKQTHPALVLEVCGFPKGRVGLRMFGRSSALDVFTYAVFEEDGASSWGETWRFRD